MNEIVIAVILGIVEGVTEFLPISSTGHLILASQALNFTGAKVSAFQVFIQLGAILAVVGYFWKRLSSLARLVADFSAAPKQAGELNAASARRFVAAIVLAFLPAATIGFLAHDAIIAALFKPRTVAVALIAGGAGIILIEKFRPRPTTFIMENLSWTQAVMIGVAQCMALIPGMSRSASTIMGGLLARLDNPAAAEFSFFLAIPTMFAATIYSIVKSWSMLSNDDLVVFVVGLLVSMIVAWGVIAAFMAFIKRHSFVVFGWYRIIFGVGLLAALYLGWM